MDILTQGFSIQHTGQSVQKGIGNVTSGIGRGVQGVGKAVGIDQTSNKQPSGEGPRPSQPVETSHDGSKTSTEAEAPGKRASSLGQSDMPLNLFISSRIRIRNNFNHIFTRDIWRRHNS